MCALLLQIFYSIRNERLPAAKLYCKTSNGEARLAYLGHLLIENCHGLIVHAMATEAGTAERDAAMLSG